MFSFSVNSLRECIEDSIFQDGSTRLSQWFTHCDDADASSLSAFGLKSAGRNRLNDALSIRLKNRAAPAGIAFQPAAFTSCLFP
jgi:hypothetical protein